MIRARVGHGSDVRLAIESAAFLAGLGPNASETHLRSFVRNPMTQAQRPSGPTWQIWAGVLVFLGIVATIAVAFMESFVG